MAAIQKRKGPHGTRYRVLIRRKGHVESATFPRLDDAKRWATQTEAAIDNGSHFYILEARKHTLADVVDRYCKTVVPGKKSGRAQERILRCWVQELGGIKLSDLTPALLGEYRDKLAARKTYKGTKRTAGSVNRHLAYLSHPLTLASREWGWMDSNPMRKVSRLREPRGRVRFLDDDERRRLLEVCKDSAESRLYPLVVLALSTGARQGELLGLRWPDVDLKRRVAVLHDTKNRERRALPLSGLALDLLRDMKLSKVRRIDSDLVFAGSNGRGIFPRHAWAKALSEAQIDDFRFHDLRHSAASYLAMNGATLAEIAEVLGHKTLAMVKRYSHLTEQHTSKVVARMNQAIFGSD